MSKLHHPSWYENHIVDVYHSATNTEKADGRLWYPHAKRLARAIAKAGPSGFGTSRAAALIAALSPRMLWSENVKIALDAATVARERQDMTAPYRRAGVRFATRQAFPLRREKAIRLLIDLDNPEDLELGPKCEAFWRAIMGDTNSVTVDVWAARVARFPEDKLTPKNVEFLQGRYMNAAHLVGESPRDIQAITWVVQRGDAS